MNKNKNIFKAAAIQASPVFLDKKATVDTACDLIAKAWKFDAAGHYNRPDVFKLELIK